jgi:hypothetical protein
MGFSEDYKVTSALESVLSNVNSEVIKPLVLAHVTSYKHLSKIISDKNLSPLPCNVLKDDVLYLSYGAPFFKKSPHFTQDPEEFPIVIIFTPEMHDKIDCYFPFDTGAASGKKYGKKWKSLSNIYDYHIKKKPENIVSAFYGSNSNYIVGKAVDYDNINIEPAPYLRKFLKDDLTALDIDERQRTIECVTKNQFPLVNKVLWVAYPDLYFGDNNKIIEKIKELKGYNTDELNEYQYHVGVSASPSQLLQGIKMRFIDDHKTLFA